MQDTSHLCDDAANALSLPISERIHLIWTLKDAWIPYPKANQILRQLEEFLDRPQTDRMLNLLIWGPQMSESPGS